MLIQAVRQFLRSGGPDPETVPARAVKLNLGCGSKKLEGYVNVDKFGEPDVRHDLESFPWPWPDDSVEEVLLVHVLEHLGHATDVFIGIMKELYRVCRGGALVKIIVPHPRHDSFISDPTHVRVVTPGVLALFSRENGEMFVEKQWSNPPLALYHGVDFRLLDTKWVLDDLWRGWLDAGKITQTEVETAMRDLNNVVSEIRMVLEVVKAPRAAE